MAAEPFQQHEAPEAPDAVSGASIKVDPSLADDTGLPAPPCPAPPGTSAQAAAEEIDAATGATPGVASACRELDMADSAEVARRLGIKPPGIA